MLTAEENYRLIAEIDANRRFLIEAYRSNPTLLAALDEKDRRIVLASMGDLERLDETLPAISPAVSA